MAHNRGLSRVRPVLGCPRARCGRQRGEDPQQAEDPVPEEVAAVYAGLEAIEAREMELPWWAMRGAGRLTLLREGADD